MERYKFVELHKHSGNFFFFNHNSRYKYYENFTSIFTGFLITCKSCYKIPRRITCRRYTFSNSCLKMSYCFYIKTNMKIY